MKRLLYLAALSIVAVLMLAPAALAQDVDCPQLSYEEAQAVLAQDPSDPNGLDADGDGIACDSPQRDPETYFGNSNDDPVEAPEPQAGEEKTSFSGPSIAVPPAQQREQTQPQRQAQPKQSSLPNTGGPSLLVPAAALLLGSGVLAFWRSPSCGVATRNPHEHRS